LPILDGRIIFDTDGEMADYDLNSPFVYLLSLIEGISAPGNGKGGSEQIREGAQISEKPPQMMLGGFVYVKFDSAKKVKALAVL